MLNPDRAAYLRGVRCHGGKPAIVGTLGLVRVDYAEFLQ
jgi:hypothetical protein